jgi:hypothetical protein
MNLTQREQGLWTAAQRRARVWLDRNLAGRLDVPNVEKLDKAENRVCRLIESIVGPSEEHNDGMVFDVFGDDSDV